MSRVNKIDGNTPIRDYLEHLSNEDLKSLKKKNIMFMDQITTPDGQYLLTWEEAKRNNLI
ncbi:6190_t:CDS:2 [Rhizophagus irregularis]|nr:6190_t:CDS:2 [Rhizophagus irregularis]